MGERRTDDDRGRELVDYLRMGCSFQDAADRVKRWLSEVRREERDRAAEAVTFSAHGQTVRVVNSADLNACERMLAGARAEERRVLRSALVDIADEQREVERNLPTKGSIGEWTADLLHQIADDLAVDERGGAE